MGSVHADEFAKHLFKVSEGGPAFLMNHSVCRLHDLTVGMAGRLGAMEARIGEVGARVDQVGKGLDIVPDSISADTLWRQWGEWEETCKEETFGTFPYDACLDRGLSPSVGADAREGADVMSVESPILASGRDKARISRVEVKLEEITEVLNSLVNSVSKLSNII